MQTLGLGLMLLSIAGMAAVMASSLFPYGEGPAPESHSWLVKFHSVPTFGGGSYTFIELPAWLPWLSMAVAISGVLIWSRAKPKRGKR